MQWKRFLNFSLSYSLEVSFILALICFILESNSSFSPSPPTIIVLSFEEGIVAGGGTAYINIISKVEECLKDAKGDEKIGVGIILNALEEPVRQIAVNAGLEGSIILVEITTAVANFKIKNPLG